MTESTEKTENPIWFHTVEERYRRRRGLGEDLVLEVCRMGRESAQLSGGERDYIQVHWRRYLETARQLPDVSSGHLLDVGCFPGHLALLARVKGWKVSGISLPGQTWGDPNFESRMLTAGIRMVNVDVQRQPFPFEDQSFDAVFFNETVEHLALNPYQPLDEIWRVLRPDGLLIFSVPNLCRFDMRLAILRGASTHLSLEGSLNDTFPSDIANRHIREYTADEVRYLLEKQDKYLYQFEIEKLVMDRSWDGVFCRSDGVVHEWSRITKATLLRDVLSRFVKSLRGNIIVRAHRPSGCLCLKADRITASNFLAEEDTGIGSGFMRLPIRASWMQSEANIQFHPPRGYARYVDLYMVLPAPPSVEMRRVTVQTPTGVHEIRVKVSAEPRRFRIPLNMATDGEKPFSLHLKTETWRPSEHGISVDPRDLGVMICLNRAMLSVRPEPKPIAYRG